jgi:dTDP-D-glucose 4,6-dehydratase
MKRALITGITGQDGSYLIDTLKVIPDLTGFKGKIIYDTSKPDGQPRRRLDTKKAEQLFGFNANTAFDDGLGRTTDWYEERWKWIRSKHTSLRKDMSG